MAIARLRNPANLGRTSQEVWFIVLVVTPTKEKGTKNALETGRTFATLFADMDLRMRLLTARTEQDFKLLLWEHMKELAEEQEHSGRKSSQDATQLTDEVFETNTFNTETEKAEGCGVARGIQTDLMRRLPHYLSDYKDGVVGHDTLRKTLATVVFLYFACILPAIALGVLNYDNTKGYMDVKKVLYSQTIGGIFFAIFGGQPMVILLTTAPLALFTKVIYNICEDWDLDFGAMFACTGLWNSAFLVVYSITDASKIMKWSTRSTEEIFALFMSVTFIVDAFKDVISDFRSNYYSPACYRSNDTTDEDATSEFHGARNGSVDNESAIAMEKVVSSYYELDSNMSASGVENGGECLRQNSLLYLLLMLGTVWLSLSLYNFTKTPFLNANKRALLADCALPVSVLMMSLFGSYLFQEVKLKQFELIEGDVFVPAPLHKLRWPAILGSMGLGFSLSLLFFMDQSISGAMVNNAENRLKKGSAYHWDLLTVALLNAVLSYFGLPLLHGALPHSPLHVRAMADVEDRVDQGVVYQRIIFVRETRVTGIACHVLIGLSILSIDKLRLIPRPVLDGLFLYLAVTALHHNQLFERITLLVTEQAAYPPNHYIRTVPQRKIHLFTFVQLIQLFFLCGFGFAPIPYLKMVFPIMLLLLLPARHKLVPFLVEKKFLHSLDG